MSALVARSGQASMKKLISDLEDYHLEDSVRLGFEQKNHAQDRPLAKKAEGFNASQNVDERAVIPGSDRLPAICCIQS